MTDIIFPKIHTEGYKFLAIAILITIFLYFFSGFLGLVSLVLTIWVYYFFRDPERVSINDDNYLVSPADGSVVQVQETNGPKELNLESKKFTNEDGSFHYKKHKIYLYKEDFNDFKGFLEEAVNFIIKEKGEEVISERHQKDYKPTRKEENEKSSEKDSDLSDIEYDE